MKWQDLIALAREMAATPPSDHLHQTRLRLAVGTVYCAMYHALARSNADLLIGATDADQRSPEWKDTYMALGGYQADQRAGRLSQLPRGHQNVRRHFPRLASPATARRRGSLGGIHSRRGPGLG